MDPMGLVKSQKNRIQHLWFKSFVEAVLNRYFGGFRKRRNHVNTNIHQHIYIYM